MKNSSKKAIYLLRLHTLGDKSPSGGELPVSVYTERFFNTLGLPDYQSTADDLMAGRKYAWQLPHSELTKADYNITVRYITSIRIDANIRPLLVCKLLINLLRNRYVSRAIKTDCLELLYYCLFKSFTSDEVQIYSRLSTYLENANTIWKTQKTIVDDRHL